MDETAAKDGLKKADTPTNHVALGSPLMQDGAEWSSNGSPAHRTPSSPLFVVKDHQQALSRSRAGSMTENGYGSYGSTTSSRYHGMGSPDLRQENGSKSPGFLPPPPPLIPITVGGGGVPKPCRLSDVQAASRIGGTAPPSTTGTPPTAKSETNLPRTGSGGSTQSSPRLAGGVPFPRPPPVLAHAESTSFQRMSPMSSVPPPPPPLLPPSQVIAPTPPLLLPPAPRTTSSSDAREEDSQSGSSSSTGSTPIKKLATIGLGLS